MLYCRSLASSNLRRNTWRSVALYTREASHVERNGMFCVRAIWNTIECSGIWGESYRVLENILGESDGV